MYPQFYLAHNHDDYKVTNNGSYPGGQLIFIETDFPGTDYESDPPVITEPHHVCRMHPGRTISSRIIHYPANRKF
jgi:hypothetical protein